MTQLDVPVSEEIFVPDVPPFLDVLVSLVSWRKNQLYALMNGGVSPAFMQALNVEIATLSEVVRVAQKLAAPELKLDSKLIEAEAATIVPP